MSISIYAIGDLHLSGAKDKPMDVFGKHWTNHWDRIRNDWVKRVISEEDIVLIPGDISWAMKLQDAVIDLDSIGSLPGRKVMIKGNHDYWWSSVSKVRSILHPSMYVLQNDSTNLSGYTFCGTRGWINPSIKDFSEQDAKVYKRELQRLKLSLESAVNNDREVTGKLIVLLHYPPFDDKGQPTEAVEIISQYKPAHVVYGHLHDEGTRFAFEGIYEGTQYHLVSCDYLDFRLKQII
jgi:predicted phosphohydrolase